VRKTCNEPFAKLSIEKPRQIQFTFLGRYFLLILSACLRNENTHLK
jgi:hypothetical protein